MMNYIIIMNITTMATYVILQFNDGEIKLSASSFLFKYSNFLRSFDIEEDNEIPLLCSKTYVTENNTCVFDDKTDLSFMFTLQPNKFLEVCKFLDIICYENNDNIFSKNFIMYVMKKVRLDIQIIHYFMQPEIRSILNYINKENADIQIKSCTPIFYLLYLTIYKEKIIKHNRIDIYELLQNKEEYYRYINKYNNQLTYMVKETQEYKKYIKAINNRLRYGCYKNNLNVSEIKKLIKQGADINSQDNHNRSSLHFAMYMDNLEAVKYLINHGIDVNLQDNNGKTALHFASQRYNNFKTIQLLIKYGANVNLQDNNGNTALHYASQLKNNNEVIKYLQQVN